MIDDRRLEWALTVLIVVVTAIPTALHELVHALVAAPAADRVIVEMDGFGAETKIRWRDDISQWWIYATALAPCLLGMLVGGVALWTLVATGWRPPESLVLQFGAYGIAAWWLIFTSPVQDLGVVINR